MKCEQYFAGAFTAKDRVHFRDSCIGIFFQKGLEILIRTPLINRLINGIGRSRRTDLIFYFFRQVNIFDTEDTGFNVIVKSLFRSGNFRMVLQDHVGGLSLQDERGGQFIQPCEPFGGNVDASPGFDQHSPVLPMCSGCPVIRLIKAASTLFVTGIADKRSFIQLWTVVAARSKVFAMGIAVIAEPAHFFADRSIGSTDVLLPAVFGKGTFISGFIEMVVLLEGTVLFNLFRDGGRIFP